LEALGKIGGDGLVAFNDGRKNAYKQGATEFLMTRNFIIEYNCGVMCFQCYACDFSDTESDRRARRVDKFIWAKDAHVDHLWEGTKRKPEDIAYKLAAERREGQQQIFEARKAAGWPDDQERILHG